MKLPDIFYGQNVYWAHMITFRCNGQCPYCLVEGRGPTLNSNSRYKELPGEDVLRIWNSIEGHEGMRLSIIGGECTLHRDFVEIIQGLEGYFVTITTNLATPFFEKPEYWKGLQVGYKLRVNTTFHPSSGLTPDLYAERIRTLREHDVWVDQIGMVQHPALDREHWRKEFERVDLPMRQITYLGFWTEESGFASDIQEGTQWPNEGSDASKIMNECGIDDIPRYQIQCGQSQDSEIEWDCAHGTLCFLVAPDGTLHECHYKLYYDFDRRGNVLGEFTPVTKPHKCSHFGKCNWCDIPRLRMTGLDWETFKVIQR